MLTPEQWSWGLAPERLLPLALLGLATAGLSHSRLTSVVIFLVAALAGGALLPVTPLDRFSLPAVFILSGAALIGGDRWTARVLPAAVILLGLLIGHQLWSAEVALGTRLLAYAIDILVAIAAGLLARVLYRPWLSIPLRIGGSWLVAIGVIFLAMVAHRGSAPPPSDIARVATVPFHDPNSPHIHGPNGEVIYLPTGHGAQSPAIAAPTGAIGKTLGDRNQP